MCAANMIDIIVPRSSSHMAGRFVYSEAANSRGVMSAFDLLLLDTMLEGMHISNAHAKCGFAL